MTTPVEREYVTFRRGEVREIILANFREGLRAKTDPETGLPFTESTIKRVTQEGSRFYVEADADDLVLMAVGKRAEFLSQQLSHDRAGHAFLVERHSVLWDEPFLPGFSATGQVLATGNPGATYVGSTTIPDQLATYGVDQRGNRYQVYIGGVADADREAELTLASIDTGIETNIPVGEKIRWVNPPIGSDPEATVIDADFSGGQPPENDADYQDRLGARIRHKPAAGNAAQFRAWCRESSVSVDDGFIYPAAFNAGSVLAVVLQKRGSTVGPNARLPSAGVLTAVEDRIVPPASPVVPPHVHVVVVAPQARSTNMVLLLDLLRGSATGWEDVEPFPSSRGALSSVAITTVTSQSNFQITSGAAGQLPGAVAGPLAGVHLMVWNDAISAFERLDVSTVEDLGAGVYRVLLSAAPVKTLVVGDYVSPSTARRDAIAQGVTEYFDSLGPGEVVDLDTDVRGSVAFRRPIPSEEAPQRAGQAVINFITESLGSALADAQLDVISVSTPSVPTDPLDGPELLVPGKLNVLPLS
jgi:Baseplate J-like protein